MNIGQPIKIENLTFVYFQIYYIQWLDPDIILFPV